MRFIEELFASEDLAKQLKLQRLAVLFVFSACVFMFGVLHQAVNPLLEFNRSAIEGGQVWRLLSCNLVHLSSNHMFMNLSVYVLSVLIFGANISLRAWYLSLLACFAAVGLGLLLFYPAVIGYVGLSGALYGIVTFGLLLNWRQNPVLFALSYFYIAYKVISQQFSGYDPTEMMGFIGGNVIPQAHLLGLIAGNGCAILWYVLGMNRKGLEG